MVVAWAHNDSRISNKCAQYYYFLDIIIIIIIIIIIAIVLTRIINTRNSLPVAQHGFRQVGMKWKNGW